jgi:hypothetical protein
MHYPRFSIRREFIIITVVIMLSMLLLPGLIYVVGGRLFGAYGTAGGVGQIYLATLGDLVAPRLAAWTLLLGPALCVALLRAIFRLTASNTADNTTDKATSVANLRREPTIGN